MRAIFAFCLLAGLLVGCSSLRVTTDHADGTDFSRFRTFAYRDSTNSVAASSPLAHQRIVAAIRRGMTGAGLTEVAGNPDVFVTYYAGTERETHFHTTYSGVDTWSGVGRSSPRVGVGVASSTTRPTTITQGTLVIDVWDASRDTLLWRSVATGTLSSNPERNTRAINEAVERAFRNFPPQR